VAKWRRNAGSVRSWSFPAAFRHAGRGCRQAQWKWFPNPCAGGRYDDVGQARGKRHAISELDVHRPNAIRAAANPGAATQQKTGRKYTLRFHLMEQFFKYMIY
jgi:hypothetical protein